MVWVWLAQCVPPMSSHQRMPHSVSEPAPFGSLLVSPQVFSSAPTFVLTLLSPLGLAPIQLPHPSLVCDVTFVPFSPMVCFVYLQ